MFNPIFFFFFSLSLIITIVTSQERAPHGLVYQNPEAFSPSAYDFFHPNSQKHDPCTSSKCSPLPLAVEATQIHESQGSKLSNGRKQLGAGGIVGIIFGVAFVVVLAMSVYHVKVTRKANMIRAKANNSVQPHV
ncbi:unnamed protein product [Trifolium pratense]|uniref:Uncharacterized protein n=1 Tax=Trifolium pratense TaxID=57577 RepID=A0ACB0KXM2_TRIPR|nr:unnamed protein product [Trifolium pratense]